jgi:hypothetical protein
MASLYQSAIAFLCGDWEFQMLEVVFDWIAIVILLGMLLACLCSIIVAARHGRI